MLWYDTFDLQVTLQPLLYLVFINVNCFKYLSLSSIYTTASAAFSTTSAMKLNRLVGGRDESSMLVLAAETVLRGDSAADKVDFLFK